MLMALGITLHNNALDREALPQPSLEEGKEGIVGYGIGRPGRPGSIWGTG